MVTKYYPLAGGTTAVRKGVDLNYLHTDHLSSVRLTTDDAGWKIAELSYFPYGSIFSQTTLNLPTDRLYTSQIRDDSTNLYFYNARQYNPTTSNFISADTVFQTVNGYSYGGNNPITFVDNGNNPVSYKESTNKLAQALFTKYSIAEGSIAAIETIRQSIINGEIDISSISNRVVSSSDMKEITSMILDVGPYYFGNWKDPDWREFGTTPDIRAMNKTSLERINLAFALAVFGQENSFSVYEVMRSNAHIAERFMIGERLVNFYRNAPYNYQDQAPHEYVNAVYMETNLQFEALLYALRMKAGYAGIRGEFDIINSEGNINWEIAGDYFGGNPESKSRQLWIKNVSNYYDIFREFAEKYPEYGWLMEDVRSFSSDSSQ